MADSSKIKQLKERFAQQARARIPFNPVDGVAITGANVARLKTGMEMFGWTDYRFVSAEQAKANGWTIRAKAESVVITTRNPSNGVVTDTKLFNGASVRGMPSLEAMLAMSEEAMLKMRGEAVEVDEPDELQQEQQSLPAPEMGPAAKAAPTLAPSAPAPVQQASEVSQGSSSVVSQPETAADVSEEAEDEISIRPVPLPELAVDAGHVGGQQAIKDLFLDEPVVGALDNAANQRDAAGVDVQPNALQAAAPEVETDFAVMAPYWLDGLHNHDGIALAESVNRLIEAQKLAKNKAAIATMLNTYPDNRRLGLDIVPRSKYLNDPHRKVNVAEPVQLLEGELVRDKEGAYRPKAGGMAVLQDKGTSLVLKNKSEQAYRGAMELALAKGWKAIELKGKPNMLAQAWLEAKVMGLEVVNYAPTEQDREKLAQRMAEEVKKREAAAAKADALAPEQVEVRPVQDGTGKQVMATVTSHVERTNKIPQQLSSPAAAPGDSLPAEPFEEPAVTRTVTRVGDVVRDEVTAGVAKPRAPKKAAASLVDREVSEAVEEAKLEQSAVDLEKGATLVAHGPAPYDHNPKNKESYFVTVEDDNGHSRTVWGKDLPRSLAEAGAMPGDKISLVDADRKPVEVEVKELDGTRSWKPANFVTWSTTVLSRAAEVAQAQAQAQVPTVDVVTEGLHVGPIVRAENGKIAQKSGRDPNKLVWHDVSNLKGPVPAVGEMAEINYAKGQGQVKEPQREQELGR